MPRPRWRTPLTDQLFTAILDLKTVQEAERLFEDLCTIKEISDLSHRLEIARLLHGGAKDDQVVAAMRRSAGPDHAPSTATISRINRFLKYGAEGYRLILDRLASKS